MDPFTSFPLLGLISPIFITQLVDLHQDGSPRHTEAMPDYRLSLLRRDIYRWRTARF